MYNLTMKIFLRSWKCSGSAVWLNQSKMKNRINWIIADFPQCLFLVLIPNQLNSGTWSIRICSCLSAWRVVLTVFAGKSEAREKSSGKWIFSYFIEDTSKSSRLWSLHCIQCKRKINEKRQGRFIITQDNNYITAQMHETPSSKYPTHFKTAIIKKTSIV